MYAVFMTLMPLLNYFLLDTSTDQENDAVTAIAAQPIKVNVAKPHYKSQLDPFLHYRVWFVLLIGGSHRGWTPQGMPSIKSPGQPLNVYLIWY